MILYGASGHCKVVIDALRSNKINIEYVLDDQPKGEHILFTKIIKVNNANSINLENVIVTIGDNKTRKKIVNQLKATFTKVIHSQAIVSDFCEIGSGTVIFAGAIVNASAQIGEHCIINSAVVIEHDCIIENFVHISPNASLAGNVHVGEGAHIGIGAVILQGVSIGKWAVVGAGAVVLSDIADYTVAVGNPAKTIKINNQFL